MISRTVLAEATAKALKSDGTSKTAKSMAAYLMEEGRTGELQSLMRDMRQYRADHDGIVEVNAVSAHPIGESVKADIEAEIRRLYPGLKSVIINSVIDESAVGGIRLELANAQLDLTVRAKLNKLKQAVTN